MAQYVLYNTIGMVYFKQKNRTRKSNPLFTVKSSIESHINKSGYGGIDNCIYFTVNRERTRVDVHITIINQFQPAGWPWQSLLQLLSLDVSRWKKVPGTSSKKERCSRDTPSCSAPVSTWEYSAARFLSFFSTRLHEIFSCEIAILLRKPLYPLMTEPLRTQNRVRRAVF